MFKVSSTFHSLFENCRFLNNKNYNVFLFKKLRIERLPEIASPKKKKNVRVYINYFVNASMATRQVLRKLWRNIRPAMYTSGLLFAHCTSFNKPCENEKLKLKPPDINRLTHEYMIKQSALDVANGATQALTVTYMAIVDLSAEYRTLLNELISLLEETVTQNVSDEHWDLIVEVRNEMHDVKEKITRLTTYMDYVYKMAVASAELNYMCGTDSLSNTLQQRIEDAFGKVKAETDSNTELERAYWRMKERCIKGNKETTVINFSRK